MNETIKTQTTFATDCLKGLTSNPKYLNSKYFYDEIGSRIFQQIMEMPEYYLTNCELEIFDTQKKDILDAFTEEHNRFELIELGAGDGLKTKILLSHFKQNEIKFRYVPVDISKDAVHELINNLQIDLPGLEVKGEIGDYFHCIKNIQLNGYGKKVILFLGSNIGNMDETQSLGFLNQLKKFMNPMDLLFIGFDLKKDPNLILDAYDDPHGHTAAFNLNLLRRMNKELGANFRLSVFKHHETYDPQTGTAKSYLISLNKQEVYFSNSNEQISFEKWESISTEISQKYDSKMIESLAEKSGFTIVKNFHDHQNYFTNSLWKLKN